MRWLTTKLAAVWWLVMAIVRVTWACRAAALSVAVGFGLIAFTDQARDIVIASGSPSLTGKSGIFIAVLFWAVFAWYWARTTLDYDFVCPLPGPDAPRWQVGWQRFWAGHIPRIIGALGILSVVYAFHTAKRIYANAGDTEHAAAFGQDAWRYAIYALVFYIVVWVRRPLMLFLVQHTRLFGSPYIANWLVPAAAPTPRLFSGNPLALIVLVLSLLASPLFYILVARDPVGLSAFFRGAVPAVLFGLALIVPVTSALVILSARWRFPLFGLAVFWIVVASGIVGDLHDVRTLRSLSASSQPYKFDDKRPLLKQAFFDWWQANKAEGRRTQ